MGQLSKTQLKMLENKESFLAPLRAAYAEAAARRRSLCVEALAWVDALREKVAAGDFHDVEAPARRLAQVTEEIGRIDLAVIGMSEARNNLGAAMGEEVQNWDGDFWRNDDVRVPGGLHPAVLDVMQYLVADASQSLFVARAAASAYMAYHPVDEPPAALARVERLAVELLDASREAYAGLGGRG